MLEPSWHDDVVVVVFPLLGVVATLDEELERPITTKAGSKGNTVWSTRRGAWCPQGACFLECTCLRVKADSSLRRDGWFVRDAGITPQIFYFAMLLENTK
jgi:hypothetical protein